MKVIGGFFLLILLSGMVCASDKIKQKKNKLVYEKLAIGYVTCAAYFFVVSKIYANSIDLEKSKVYATYSKKLKSASIVVANITNNKKMAKKVTSSRFDMYKKEMFAESPITNLNNKYLETCKVAMSSKKEFVNLIITKHLENK